MRLILASTLLCFPLKLITILNYLLFDLHTASGNNNIRMQKIQRSKFGPRVSLQFNGQIFNITRGRFTCGS